MPKNTQPAEKIQPADIPLPDRTVQTAPAKPARPRPTLWESLVRQGLGELALKVGTGLALLLLVLVIIWVMGRFYLHGNRITLAAAGQEPTATPEAAIQAPAYTIPTESAGVLREADLHTILPSHPRFDVITYTVQQGDTVFGIAEKYGLRPETILWGNYNTLYDDPEWLRPGQELNILPTDGTYYEWNNGDSLAKVAEYFGVTTDDIINWPGNHLDASNLGDLSNPNIAAGTWLIVPGGSRQFVSWTGIRITRDNPAQARVYGEGYCGTILQGYVGSGTFIWPTVWHYISGYNWSPETNHYAIDIGGAMDQPIYAADNGVIVYAGWNDHGYGNMVIIDHEHWQTLYAHLDYLTVSCGQNVEQGDIIGYMGVTGNSTGPHLHFEMYSDQYGRVNPLLFLPPP
jgi:LysM repeat protein